MLKKFPNYKQHDMMDCGPTCLRIIAKHYGKNFSLQTLREKCYKDREGVSMLGISDAAESIGFKTLAAQLPLDKLLEEAPLPFIAHWNQRHFIVVYEVKKNKVYVSDPAHGLIVYTKEEFKKGWVSMANDEGFALLFETTPRFDQTEEEKTKGANFGFFFKYLKPYHKYFVQLFLGLLLGMILNLIAPFLTQSMMDHGIGNQNIGFVNTILIAQLVLMLSTTASSFIQGWILLHLGARINITIISDFLAKLMRLPISYFDTKMTGDIMQRIGDHSRIERFLKSSSLNVIFSIVNLLVFGLILAYYNSTLLIIFLIGSTFHTIWLVIFLKKRRDMDYKRFDLASENQSSMIQLISGMQEIKLTGSEKQKRWEWERIQAKLFKLGMDGLSLSQYQEGGSAVINQIKNIFISYISAKSVINGEMTLGMMLSVQYIIGQLNAPIGQLLGFMQEAQDAKISIERLGEIHNKNDEEEDTENKVSIFPDDHSISLKDLNFQYSGPHSEMVLNNINLIIPQGKVTAIVGASGSGKTTLMKMLLKFYVPVQGEIYLGGINLENFSSSSLRKHCGIVMQDGYIFSDTIANNIAIGDEKVDKEKLLNAVKIANVKEFVDKLPLAYNTKIGNDGQGLSMGQRQRILIARAVYKNPEFMFFDEASSALDANNEKEIMEKLEKFFVGKTVVVIAHRLSTVKNADKIIVLNKGEIVEEGNHQELVAKRGAYYNLVKNQLELGN